MTALRADLAASFRGRRVLITGGLGFIGSNLAHALVAAGSDVTIVDSLMPSHGGSWANVEGIESELDVHELDVRDTDAAPRASRRARTSSSTSPGRRATSTR